MREPTQRSGDGYMILVAGLLLLILAAVSVLWMTQRRKLVRVEADWARRCSDLENTLTMLQSLQGQMSRSPLVDRESLDAEPMIVDGRERDVLQLPPDLGRRLGLREGDMMVVVPAHETPGD